MEFTDIGQTARIVGYFLVMIFYIFWAALAFARNLKWESASAAFTAMFLILLFQISIFRGDKTIQFVLTPLLIGWAIFGISYLTKVVIDSKKLKRSKI